MSIIRCLSNPEGLYIYSNEMYSISSSNWIYSNIDSSRGESPLCVSIKDFNQACKKWMHFSDNIMVGKFAVKEKCFKHHKVFPYSAVEIRQGQKWCYLWPSTWELICRRNLEQMD